MDIPTIITAGSITLNFVFAWIWYRRKEIRATVRKVMDAYKDNNVSEDELWEIMDKLEEVMEKK